MLSLPEGVALMWLALLITISKAKDSELAGNAADSTFVDTTEGGLHMPST